MLDLVLLGSIWGSWARSGAPGLDLRLLGSIWGSWPRSSAPRLDLELLGSIWSSWARSGARARSGAPGLDLGSPGLPWLPLGVPGKSIWDSPGLPRVSGSQGVLGSTSDSRYDLGSRVRSWVQGSISGPGFALGSWVRSGAPRLDLELLGSIWGS
jgi:hypothetical protein